MKRYLLFIICCVTANKTHGMEDFFKLLGGQQIIGYSLTGNDEREAAIKINNPNWQTSYGCGYLSM